MRVDDRIATVLRLPAQGGRLARAQFRQLVDLLGTMPEEISGQQVDTAYERLAALAAAIPVAERAALVGDPGLRLRSPRLVSFLAGAEPQVAQAAVRAAALGEDQWLDLIPALPVQARGVVRHRRNLGPRVEAQLEQLGIHDRALPPVEAQVAQTAPEPAPQPITPEPTGKGEGIGALVRRIEAYRRAREAGTAPQGSPDAPRLPLNEDNAALSPAERRAFDFATDSDGRIVWSDPGMAPMAVGLRLGECGGASRALDQAIRTRQPLRRLSLDLPGAPAIAGPWIIDAAPAFDPATGRFTGYEGRMRRPPAPSAIPAEGRSVADSEADRLRQLLHELRTPVNAVQGFAEVIQQQLFGPTPHEYRALAASIASDAARILAGFDELERLAKLDSGAMDIEAGEADLAAIVRAMAAQLAAPLASRSAALDLRDDGEALPVPLAAIECQRLAWRLIATMAANAGPGEQLRARLRRKGSEVRLTLHLPRVLADRSESELFHSSAPAGGQALSTGMFGTGFALRLARAEARAAGGRLDLREGRLRLTLPGLTKAGPDHSHTAGSEAAS